jgi:hypothetical protein
MSQMDFLRLVMFFAVLWGVCGLIDKWIKRKK